jgi:hypothetical protein
MRFTRTIDAAVVAAAIAMLPSAASAQAAKTDVTGKWSFTVESPAGTGTPTVTFKQQGDTISGRYISQALGEKDFTGTLKDGKISFSFDAESGGQAFTMLFTGALDGADAMKGSIDFSGMATGSFAGKRQKP